MISLSGARIASVSQVSATNVRYGWLPDRVAGNQLAAAFGQKQTLAVLDGQGLFSRFFYRYNKR